MADRNIAEIGDVWRDEVVYGTRDDIFSYYMKANQAYPCAEPFILILKDEEGKVIGKLLGKVYLHCLFIDYTWIDAEYKKIGYGYRFLVKIEEIVEAKGCKIVHLGELSFQAKDFCKKYAFIIFGIVDVHAT